MPVPKRFIDINLSEHGETGFGAFVPYTGKKLYRVLLQRKDELEAGKVCHSLDDVEFHYDCNEATGINHMETN